MNQPNLLIVKTRKDFQLDPHPSGAEKTQGGQTRVSKIVDTSQFIGFLSDFKKIYIIH